MFLSGCNRIYHSPVRAHRMRPYVATRAFPSQSVGEALRSLREEMLGSPQLS